MYTSIIVKILIIFCIILIVYLVIKTDKIEKFDNRKINKRLFNIDLHISVIEDFININKNINSNLSINDNSISNHSYLMNKEKSTKYLTSNNWKNILNNNDKLDLFYKKHKEELEKYDGFVITHTPAFILLYEKFNKPIIIINSCRYENPFMDNIDKWTNLNKKIKEMYNKNLLTVVSNNKADHKYFKIGTGIDSYILPSLCLYTNSKYNCKKSEFLLVDKFNVIPKNNLLVKKETLKATYSGKHYTLTKELFIFLMKYQP